jgi:tRNA-specific 2-thiouridylase
LLTAASLRRSLVEAVPDLSSKNLSGTPGDRSAWFDAGLTQLSKMDRSKKSKAIGLLSGGLDSILATKMILDMGFEVIALNLKTPFCCCDTDQKCYSESVAQEFNIPLKRIHGGEDYMQVVKNPKHGYGKNMNPCIDCRIFLFKKAKQLMEDVDAEFIFTGEVLGERPMSQRMQAMRLIESESDLKGKVLRPLSARLLEPTLAEKKGVVDRQKLLSIQGRSRKPQMALARSYRIDDYPCPAGGCLLTDKGFARRLRDSLDHREDSSRNIFLLKIGRHFRLPSQAKVIAGRNQEENEALLSVARPSELKFTVQEYKSTYAILLGEATLENQTQAARICARYCDEKGLKALTVKVWSDSPERCRKLEVPPLDQNTLSSIRI